MNKLIAVLAIFGTMGFALAAAADQHEKPYLALEPYFAYGQLGDVEYKAEGQQHTVDATRQNLELGAKAIVPLGAGEKVSLRARVAYAYEQDEFRYQSAPLEESTRKGFVGEVSFRYWFGGPGAP